MKCGYSRYRVVVTDQIDPTFQAETSEIMMGRGLSGPAIRPLQQVDVFDKPRISDYITKVLVYFDKQDAYGIFAGVCHCEGPVIPTFIFGLPGASRAVLVLPPSPDNLPIWVREDKIFSTNGFKTAWSTTPVNNLEELTLESCSVGIQGCRTLVLCLFFEINI